MPGRDKAGAGSPSAPPEAAVWRLHLSFPRPERSVSAGHAPRGVAFVTVPSVPPGNGYMALGTLSSPETDRQTAGSLLDGAQGALPCGGAQGTWYSPRVRDGFLWFFPESRPAPSQPHPFVSAAPFTGRPSTDPRSVTLAHHMPVLTPPSLRSFLEQGARRDLSSCLQRSALCLGPRTVATSP